MSMMRSLTVELVPMLLVGTISGIVSGMSAYMAVREDIVILTVNQGLMLDGIKEGNLVRKELYEGLKEHDVRIAVLESKE